MKTNICIGLILSLMTASAMADSYEGVLPPSPFNMMSALKSDNCELSLDSESMEKVSRSEKIELKRITKKKGYNLVDSKNDLQLDGINIDFSEIKSEHSFTTESYTTICAHGAYGQYGARCNLKRKVYTDDLDISGTAIIQKTDKDGVLKDVDIVNLSIKNTPNTEFDFLAEIVKKLPKCKTKK